MYGPKCFKSKYCSWGWSIDTLLEMLHENKMQYIKSTNEAKEGKKASKLGETKSLISAKYFNLNMVSSEQIF